MEENEIIEVIPEETTQEEVVPEETEDQKTEELNELLIEYIKTQMEEETEETEEIEEVNNSDQKEAEPEEIYDLQIGEILEELRSSESNLEYQSIMLDEYNDNNSLSSDMTEISLSNMLLIMIYMSILFTALLNFSRRIF